MQRPRNQWLLGFAFLLGAAGCGDASYEGSFQENSQPFFAHQATLDRELAPAWKSGPISFRPPREFLLVPAVKTDPLPLPDPLPPELTGVVARFRDDIDAYVDTAAVEPIATEGSLIVFSNQSLLKDLEPAVKPGEYDEYLKREIVESLGLDATAVSFESYSLGTDQRFVTTKRFDRFRLSVPFEGVPRVYELYFYRQGSLQVGMLYIVPAQPVRSERIREQIPLSLETLTFDETSRTSGPVPSKTGGAPGF